MSDIDSSLTSGEEVVMHTSKHWIAPVADSKWAVLMILVWLLLAWLETDSTSGLTGFFNRLSDTVRFILALGAVGWIAYNVIAWRTAQYYVTNRRMIGSEGLIRRRSTDTLLSSISDVRVTESFVGRSLGYGSITILTSSGEAGGDTFTTMKGVQEFKKRLIEQKSGVEAHHAPAHKATPAHTAAPAPTNITATLMELAKLRDAGAITAAEYEAKKTDLLSRI